MLVIAPDLTSTSYRYWAAIAVITGYAAFRTVRPIAYEEGRATFLQLILDAVIHVQVVMVTGVWSSPFAFSLVPSVLLSGLARGTRFGVRLVMTIVITISVAHVLSVPNWRDGARDAVAWSAVLLVVAVLAGLARQLSSESARQQTMALDRMNRLAEANALLYSLNRVARTLPASLDLDEVLDSTLARLHELVDFEAATVYLYEDADRSWTPVRGTPERGTAPRPTDALHHSLRRAISSPRPVLETSLRLGVTADAHSGIYAALRARGATVGVVAVESTEADRFTQRDVELVGGLVEALGTAVDNARLFSRLRAVGADEERTRIARDLHDQIGQSLASLAFGLDHARRVAERGGEVVPVLDDLRGELRGTVRDVREALYDLRTDVNLNQDLGATLRGFLARVEDRTPGLTVEFEDSSTGRLPILQEKEVWQIAREAIRNIERHAGATHIRAAWSTDGHTATLEVADDGKGFDRLAVAPTSFGLLGMRERASLIGATLDVQSIPGRGTTVRLHLAPEQGGVE